MAAPLTGPWSAETVISASALNKTTHGSGSTTEREALTSWPTTRMFFDTTAKQLYANFGSDDNIIWAPVGDPIGAVKMFAGASTATPNGWLLCDGSAVSRTGYPRLFAVIGTAFGDGDGSTTFNVPDYRNKFPRGAGAGDNPGTTGGEDEHTLTEDELPAHDHGITDPGHTHGSVYALGGGNNGVASAVNQNFQSGRTSGSSTTGITVNEAGGGSAHENRPAFLEILFIIKY